MVSLKSFFIHAVKIAIYFEFKLILSLEYYLQRKILFLCLREFFHLLYVKQPLFTLNPVETLLLLNILFILFTYLLILFTLNQYKV